MKLYIKFIGFLAGFFATLLWFYICSKVVYFLVTGEWM
jgi:hypothetical protein